MWLMYFIEVTTSLACYPGPKGKTADVARQTRERVLRPWQTFVWVVNKNHDLYATTATRRDDKPIGPTSNDVPPVVFDDFCLHEAV